MDSSLWVEATGAITRPMHRLSQPSFGSCWATSAISTRQYSWRSRGIPIAEFGLQKAYERWFRSFQPLVALAQQPTKRSERIRLPGPRRSGDDTVRHAVTNAVLDKGINEYQVATVIERLDLDEVLVAVDEGPSYFVEAVSSLAFSVLRKTSCRATRADLEWGRDTSRALFGFVIAVADRFSATGTEVPSRSTWRSEHLVGLPRRCSAAVRSQVLSSGWRLSSQRCSCSRPFLECDAI